MAESMASCSSQYMGAQLIGTIYLTHLHRSATVRPMRLFKKKTLTGLSRTCG
jgi:hypothetical protein